LGSPFRIYHRYKHTCFQKDKTIAFFP